MLLRRGLWVSTSRPQPVVGLSGVTKYGVHHALIPRFVPAAPWECAGCTAGPGGEAGDLLLDQDIEFPLIKRGPRARAAPDARSRWCALHQVVARLSRLTRGVKQRPVHTS